MKNKNKLKRLLPCAVSAGMLVLAIACNPNPSEPTPGEQGNDGTYEATLTTLNTGIGGNTLLGAGAVTITIAGDAVDAHVLVNGVPIDTAHGQFIYEGGECPTVADDTNADTYVDAVEGIAKYGSILIPLDQDINSQDAGANSFPVADTSGTYDYSQSASLASMLADLVAPDTDTTDSIVKLPAGTQTLDLAGRTIVIHGVLGDTTLPTTVGTIQGVPNTSSLPIACGVITKAPGETGGTSGGTTGGTVGSTIGGTGGSTIGGTGGTVGSTIGGTGGSTIGGSTIGGTGGSTIGGTGGTFGSTIGGTTTSGTGGTAGGTTGGTIGSHGGNM